MARPIDKTGQPVEVPEAEHCYRCKVFGALVNCRDLGQVFDHEPGGSHPKADGPQVTRRDRRMRSARPPRLL
jgi:hypothetical protein